MKLREIIREEIVNILLEDEQNYIKDFEKIYFATDYNKRDAIKKEYNRKISSLKIKKQLDIKNVKIPPEYGSNRNDFKAYELSSNFILLTGQSGTNAYLIDKNGKSFATDAKTSVGKNGIDRLKAKLKTKRSSI